MNQKFFAGDEQDKAIEFQVRYCNSSQCCLAYDIYHLIVSTKRDGSSVCLRTSQTIR